MRSYNTREKDITREVISDSYNRDKENFKKDFDFFREDFLEDKEALEALEIAVLSIRLFSIGKSDRESLKEIFSTFGYYNFNEYFKDIYLNVRII